MLERRERKMIRKSIWTIVAIGFGLALGFRSGAEAG
jgi:hypothetical protein